MIMENRKSSNYISRRQFIGNFMLATTSAALITGCKTSLFAGGKSSPYQIGAYTRVWGSVNYRVALDGMVEAGYKFAGLSTHEKGRVVDRDTPPEVAVQVGEEIRKRGLELVTLSGGSHDVSKSLKEGIAGLKRLIDNAVHCGAPTIQINAINNPDLEQHFYRAIAECSDYAAEKGVMITLKPHGNVGAYCLEQIKKVNHDNFKLWYDPGNVYHATHGETDPVNDAVGLNGYVVGMAVKDFRLPRDVNVTPGTGMVDFPKLLDILKQGGFVRGPLVVELVSQGDYAHATAEARKAREFLEKIIS